LPGRGDKSLKFTFNLILRSGPGWNPLLANIKIAPVIGGIKVRLALSIS